MVMNAFLFLVLNLNQNKNSGPLCPCALLPFGPVALWPCLHKQRFLATAKVSLKSKVS